MKARFDSALLVAAAGARARRAGARAAAGRARSRGSAARRGPPRPLPGAADATPRVRRSTSSSRPGGYAYNSGGRRDPFVSLQRPVAADRGPKTRKPGMEGFLIQEIALKGIVQDDGHRHRRRRQAGPHRDVPGRGRQVVLRDARGSGSTTV